MAAQKKYSCKVLRNTEAVRTIVRMYVSLHPSYQHAAKAIGVNKDTIAHYCTQQSNIALVVFEKIAKEVEANYSPDEILAATGGLPLKAIKAKARQRNGLPIDKVMFHINDALYEIIKLYCSFHKSYAQGARALGINPRTFKSYLLRQTATIPRKYVQRILDALKTFGYPEEELLKRLDVHHWNEVLIERRRSKTAYDRDTLKEELLECFERGKIRQRDVAPAIHTASKRLYGSQGRAVREAMKELAKRMTTQAHDYLMINDFDRASATIEKFRSHIELYEDHERAVNKALRRERRIDWESLVAGYYDMLDELVEELEERRREFQRRKLKDLEGIVPIGENESVELRPYSLQESYRKGELLNHPAYGAGKVLRIFNNRHMVVQFGKRYGKKVLLMNDKNPRPEFQTLDTSLSRG
ncbi:MAG: hypothetical protein D6812_04060 [Deltaproteobacteria bacterium]|nr:MAG: hypothetical protein D6812_04060 [Deltaproteobacteria bacterium]